MRNPTCSKGGSNSLSCDVRNGNNFRPTGEPVNASDHISETFGWRQGTYNIDVYTIKSSVRGGKSRERCNCVSMNLGFLAL